MNTDMQYNLSYPLTTFNSSAIAFEFIYPLLNFEVISISSGKSFIGGYSEMNKEIIMNKLKLNGDKVFSLSSEQDHDGEPKMRVTFRRDEFSETALINPFPSSPNHTEKLADYPPLCPSAT